jgi:polyhydroxyalkanoate synthesis regulator phasin
MKRTNFFSKTMLTLVAVSMSAALFAGCQSKASSTTASQSSSSTTQSSTTQNSKRPDPAQMKQRMEDNLKALVTAGTITQAQSDKILEALTANNQNKDNQVNSKNNQQNSNQQGNNQNKQRYNPLSKLVSDGTITQAQADAVMQKIRGNRHGNNGQGSQNNTQGSQSSTQSSN